MSGSSSACPFCQLEDRQILGANEHALCIADRFPVTRGHVLVIARRHVADFFELTGEEMVGVFELVSQMRTQLERTHSPDGFNVGVNVGPSAGQTIWHVHVHLIPRYCGDVPEPRGGVRNVIPGKAVY